MSDSPSIRVREIEFAVVPTKTRFPFRYGIAAMTSAPHWFVYSTVEIDGKVSRGVASEGLPPKWFAKNPDTTFEEDDLPGMESSIRHAAETATEIGEPLSFFQFWKSICEEQTCWANKNGIPLLLAQLGTAIVERTVLDALCRSLEIPLHKVIRNNLLGIDLGSIHSELRGADLSTAFEAPPLEKVGVRHTVGLADPLTDLDIGDDDRADDGLPLSLEASIRKYGLNYFKIKLCGDLDTDSERLRELARLFELELPSVNYQISIDGNEQYRDMETFREQFEIHRSDESKAQLFTHLLFVEQPIHRDLALDDSVAKGIADWEDAPALIIDESDESTSTLPRALALGYAGTSHKNCKGIVKSLTNRVLLNGKEEGIMSAEDLANIGPVALLQDLAMVALLGISHAERNGHHYFAGLSMFSKSLQEQMVNDHGDLYDYGNGEYATLQVSDGKVDVRSINSAPFGVKPWLELR